MKFLWFIALALYVPITLLNQQRQLNYNARLINEVYLQIEEENLQTAMLNETIERLDSDEFIEWVARTHLRLARPGDRIYIDSARIR